MVKYIKHIALFLSLALIAGCNPGITDPAPATLNVAKDFFWDSEKSPSLYYEHYSFIDSIRSGAIEYSFTGLNSTNKTITVNGGIQPASGAFYYKFDSVGNLFAGGLSYSSLFGLPEGYEVAASSVVSETVNITIDIKKVLALDGRKVVALSKEGDVYYSSTNGSSWVKSDYRKEFGYITAWTRVNNVNIVYAGTSSGSCVSSNDGGKTWMLLTQAANQSIVSIAATSTGIVFLSTGSETFYKYTAGKKVESISNSTPVYSLAVCEAYTDSSSGKTYPVLMLGTKQTGLFYYIDGKNLSPTYAKNGKKATKILSIAATGRSWAVALGYNESLSLTLLYSSDAGLSWDETDSPTQRASYLDAIQSVQRSEILIADEIGNFYLGNSLQGSKPSFSSTVNSLVGSHIRDISISESILIAAVDSVGVMISTDKGTTWVVGSKGLTRDSVYQRKTDGLLTLMPARSGGLRIGDHWQSGYISSEIMGASNPVEVNAIVVEHYSHLTLPFANGTYSDVFEVEYRYAPSDREHYSIRVFYAREYGPILFQRYIGSNLFDQSYLVKK